MEYKIVYFLNHLDQGTILDNVSFTISWIPFIIAFWLLLALIPLIFDRQNGKWVFLSIIFVLIIYFILNDLIIKQNLASIYFRERPYFVHPQDIIAIGTKWTDSSMISGHMAMTVGLMTIFVYYYKKRWVLISAIVFTLLMAFSRLHNGMHYPSDIIVGTVLGIGYGILSILLIKKIRSSKRQSTN